MKAYSAAALTALAAGAIVKRRAVKFEFGSGTYAFWDGGGPFTPVNGDGGAVVDAAASGVTFQAGGALFEIAVGSVGVDGSAPEITMRLRSVPDSSLTPDVLATIFSETWHRKRVTIFRALFDASTQGLIEVATRARGVLDQINFVAEPSPDGPGAAYLEAKVESALIEWQRSGAHDRNDESQKLTFPGDRGLENIDQTSKVRKWAKGITGK